MIFMFSFATFKLDSVENSGINTTIEKRLVAAGVCERNWYNLMSFFDHSARFSEITCVSKQPQHISEQNSMRLIEQLLF